MFRPQQFLTQESKYFVPNWALEDSPINCNDCILRVERVVSATRAKRSTLKKGSGLTETRLGLVWGGGGLDKTSPSSPLGWNATDMVKTSARN